MVGAVDECVGQAPTDRSGGLSAPARLIPRAKRTQLNLLGQQHGHAVLGRHKEPELVRGELDRDLVGVFHLRQVELDAQAIDPTTRATQLRRVFRTFPQPLRRAIPPLARLDRVCRSRERMLVPVSGV
eukprot:scaffold14602_cov118-Isochrysis_galbana.AAC.14